MKNFLLILLLTFLSLEEMSNIYQINYTGINGSEVSFEAYKGKYILIVNVASECGYTPQYEQLQSLYEQFNEKLVVIGFPCNQFGGQEPDSEEKIQQFCKKNYGVTFPLSEKIEVKGDGIHPLYQWLTDKEKNGVLSDEVKWNFHKFLIGPDGNMLASFPSAVSPLDEKILTYFE